MHQETILSWLNDAYAMEKDSEEVLEHRLSDVADEPEIKSKIEEHLNQTRGQAERLKQRIEALGGKISMIKSGFYNLMGFFKARSTGPFSDESVKNGIADYTTENMEIASYEALKAGAEEIGDKETVKVIEQNLKEEQDMANWLKSKMPMMVKNYLQTQM
ncbi:MAG TPA: ferritin-like domain-containing protein [Verrucomicrobiae bacterium]|nr:ferritin-like domain-containing protein [Verrucomicrobiae bacterium]